LPVPDYSGNFLTRQFLTGDWGGIRTNLANHGVQIGVEWDQFVQGVSNGGLDRGTAYGANLNYTIDLDLMRMDLIPGALIKFRAKPATAVRSTPSPDRSYLLIPLPCSL
jgi:carbohydrate-selective porin OprB